MNVFKEEFERVGLFFEGRLHKYHVLSLSKETERKREREKLN